MPHIGVPELVIILVIVVLIFGVGKLPEVGADLGNAIRELRQATSGEVTKESEADKAEPKKQ